MPCDSRVDLTTDFTNADHLMAALKSLNFERVGTRVSGGYEVVEGIRRGQDICFYRDNGSSGGFSVKGSASGSISEIQDAYAQQGVRLWAKAKGWAIDFFQEGKMVLLNRRTDSKLKIAFQKGNLRIDARGVKGKVDDIMKDLEDLATKVEGALVVEKHEEHHHEHHHDFSKLRSSN